MFTTLFTVIMIMSPPDAAIFSTFQSQTQVDSTKKVKKSVRKSGKSTELARKKTIKSRKTAVKKVATTKTRRTSRKIQKSATLSAKKQPALKSRKTAVKKVAVTKTRRPGRKVQKSATLTAKKQAAVKGRKTVAKKVVATKTRRTGRKIQKSTIIATKKQSAVRSRKTVASKKQSLKSRKLAETKKASKNRKAARMVRLAALKKQRKQIADKKARKNLTARNAKRSKAQRAKKDLLAAKTVTKARKRTQIRMEKETPAALQASLVETTVVKNTKAVRLVSRKAIKEVRIKMAKPDKRKIRPAAKKKLDRYPAIPVYNLHTGENVKIRLYGKNGMLRKQAFKEFNRITRCHKENRVMTMNYKLLVEIYAAWIHFGMPQVSIYSGCRLPDKKNPSYKSKHHVGDAVDFTFDGISRRSIVKYLLKRRDKNEDYKLGIGYYPNQFYVHLDIRKESKFWVQLQKPFQKIQYAENPVRYLQGETQFKKSASSKTVRK